MGGEGGQPVGTNRAFLGSQLATDLIGPTVIGIILDWQFGWKPWATLGGLAVGLLAFSYHLVLLARRLGRDDQPGPDRRAH